MKKDYDSTKKYRKTQKKGASQTYDTPSSLSVTSSLIEETKTNLIAHNNSGYSLRSFQRETYLAKGPFPPCSLRYFCERSIILSISSNEKSNFLLCGFLSFSSASRTKRSASSPVNTGVLFISNAIILRKNYSDSSYYFYCTDDSNYTC